MILTECTDCEVVQPLGERELPSGGFQSATECPECGSRSYTSRCSTDGLSGREIRDVLLTINGVGTETKRNIEQSVGNLTELKTISTEALTEIEGVGETTAERIQHAVS